MADLTAVDMQIQHPAAQDTFLIAAESAQTVTANLSTQVLSTGHGTLFLKWYSSIQPEGTGPQTELTKLIMAETDPRTWSTTVNLRVGSHVMTCTAQDKDDAGLPKEALPDLYKSMEHFGSVGGPPLDGITQPRIIHVLAARIIAPTSPPIPQLSKTSAVLEAEVPTQWLDPPYQETSQLQIRWFFRRVAAPSATVELDQEAGTLEIIPPDDPEDPDPILVPRLRYTGLLPSSVQTGTNYTLTLRVQQIGVDAVNDDAMMIIQFVN